MAITYLLITGIIIKKKRQSNVVRTVRELYTTKHQNIGSLLIMRCYLCSTYLNRQAQEFFFLFFCISKSHMQANI